MKTTVEIPDALFQVITNQAVQRGQEFDATLAEILHRGMIATRSQKLEPPVFEIDPISGHMLIVNGKAPPPGEELTPERVAEILLEQEVEWHNEASRR
jgi:hypothetical protein